MIETVSDIHPITNETPKVGENNIKFPLRLKGLGRYLIDESNSVVGKYYHGDTTVVIDAMNKRNTIYPVDEGIEMRFRTDSDLGTINDYYFGDEVVSIKVEKGKREK